MGSVQSSSKPNQAAQEQQQKDTVSNGTAKSPIKTKVDDNIVEKENENLAEVMNHLKEEVGKRGELNEVVVDEYQQGKDATQDAVNQQSQEQHPNDDLKSDHLSEEQKEDEEQLVNESKRCDVPNKTETEMNHDEDDIAEQQQQQEQDVKNTENDQLKESASEGLTHEHAAEAVLPMQQQESIDHQMDASKNDGNIEQKAQDSSEQEQPCDWDKKSRADAEVHMGAQAHLARFWDELSAEERISLMKQFDSIILEDALKSFHQSALPKASDDVREDGIYKDMNSLQAIDDVHYAVRKQINQQQLDEYWHRGLEAIADCKVAVIVLAGGQATRLGASQPKGTLSLQLNPFSGSDSLLAIQGARIARLQSIAASVFPDSKHIIQWLVMTSKATEKDTVEHLNEIVPEIGLEKDQLTVFSQNDFPCFDMDGNLMLATKCSMATSPDGNGGLYTALSPYLDALRTKGVQYVHVYCVDNVLCRVADPHFIGFCALKGADCAAKVVEKVEPHESVGVICRESNKVKVVEYSEISKEIAENRDQSGRLVLRAGNIANHFFTIDFLEHVCKAENCLGFHRAHKKIAFVNEDGQLVKPDQPNGIKLEKFVFDIFEHSTNFYLWEVNREEEFSPLKNAESARKDCMSTCRRDLSTECRRWLQQIGAQIEGNENIFIHPLRSYAGEGLEEFSEAHISTPIFISN